MRIIPVIDLRGGRAVRGRSGDRESYVPVTSLLGATTPADLSDPVALLRTYAATLRATTIYVADLDRIMGRGDNDGVVEALLRAGGARLIWDGGAADAAALARTARNGRLVPVLGTETLRSIDELRPLLKPGAPARPILSLDLREDGVIRRSALLAPLAEQDLLREAQRRGVRTAIVLFLDRVGTSRGLPLERLRRLRAAAPQVEILAGGGVASVDDLLMLRDEGCAGVLLATALHDGRITPDDLDRRGLLP